MPASEWDPKTSHGTSSGRVSGSSGGGDGGSDEGRFASRQARDGANLFRKSMSADSDEETDEVAAAADAASEVGATGQFPGQKTVGSKAAAFDEASKWAEGMSLREMLCNVHRLSAIVPERLLSRKMDSDPEAELNKVEKAYRRAIRMLHPDRSARKAQFSQYEKWLAAALFSIIKEEMSH